MPLYEVKLSWTDSFFAANEKAAVDLVADSIMLRLQAGEDLDTDSVTVVEENED